MKQHKKLIIAVLLLAISIVGISSVYAAAPLECPTCHLQTYIPNGRIYIEGRDRQFQCNYCGRKGHAYESPEY